MVVDNLCLESPLLKAFFINISLLRPPAFVGDGVGFAGSIPCTAMARGEMPALHFRRGGRR